MSEKAIEEYNAGLTSILGEENGLTSKERSKLAAQFLGRKGGQSRSPAKLAALAVSRGKRKLSNHPGAVYQRSRRARLKSKPTGAAQDE
jgi:hypothetical protein